MTGLSSSTDRSWETFDLNKNKDLIVYRLGGKRNLVTDRLCEKPIEVDLAFDL